MCFCMKSDAKIVSRVSQRQRCALRVVRVEHLLRGLRPEGRELPGNEETPETKVNREWDNPIYSAYIHMTLFARQTLSLIRDW